LVFTVLIVCACSPHDAVVPAFDVAQAVNATLRAGTARFSTTSTLELTGQGAREYAEAAGSVDLVAGTGHLEETLTPNPFPPPSEPVASVEMEAIVVKGHGFQRRLGASSWRIADGGLGSFLQMGNDEVTFGEAINEIVKPVATWRLDGNEEATGVVTRHYLGVVSPENGSRVEVWVDDNNRLRQLLVTRQGSGAIGGIGTIILKLWDYGVPVTVVAPE
jgi:hypothetical protein